MLRQQITLVGAILAISPKIAMAGPREDFLRTLAEQRPLVAELASDSRTERLTAAHNMTMSSSYAAHVENYLAYAESLRSEYDIFADVLADKDLRCLRHQSSASYRRLLGDFFGREFLAGSDVIHFNLRPDQYFVARAANSLAIRSDLTFPKLFELMKALLPASFPYKTTLVLEPGYVGGRYDPSTDVITFGNHPPNISTVMGFIHEFGHSVFRFDTSDDRLGRYVGGFNEAYAELWADQIERLPFKSEIFAVPDSELVEQYIGFRRLFGQRFYSMALILERRASQGELGVERYKTLQRRVGRDFLRAYGVPPILPISAESPGDLPLYLISDFVKQEFAGTLRTDHLVPDLLKVGHEIKGDLSIAHFKGLLSGLVKKYLDAERCGTR